MPKKHPISRTAARGTAIFGGISPVADLTGHLDSVEPNMFRLGVALSKYYRKNDPLRAKFTAIETLFGDYAKELRAVIAKEVAREDR